MEGLVLGSQHLLGVGLVGERVELRVRIDGKFGEEIRVFVFFRHGFDEDGVLVDDIERFFGRQNARRLRRRRRTSAALTKSRRKDDYHSY